MFLYVPKKFKNRRRLALIVTGIVLLVGLAIFYGPKLYDRWSVHRLMKEARTKLQAGQLRESIEPLIKIIRINPKNVLANRMIADTVEKLGSPEALQFRERALELEPDSVEDAYKLTTAALFFENPAKAERGIQLLQKNKLTPPRLLPPMLARFALLKGDNREAEKQFSEALRSDPRNPDLLLGLAGLQIESDDAQIRDNSRQILTAAKANPQFRIVALRGLLKDAIAQKDSFTTYSLADDLVNEKKATFQDRLLRLTLLHQTKDLFFSSYLDTLQKEAMRSYKTMDQMVLWITQERALDECRTWINAIPPKYITKPPLAKSVAEVFLQMENWQPLIELTLGENWEDLDYLRLAYLSIAHAGTGRRELSNETWNTSLQQAQGNLKEINVLLGMAEAQGWQQARINLLWQIAEISPTPADSLQILRQYHLQHGQTASAYRACQRLLELGISDDTLTADWLRLSLLLNQNLEKAFPMALQNYREKPDSPEMTTQLALAYIRQKRPAEAYFLLRRLPIHQLEQPYFATYYGIVCSALGLFEAGRYLNLGIGISLFPEEALLVREARQKIKQDWLPENFRNPARDTFDVRFLLTQRN